MRYQDQLVKATQKALDDISRSALAVPQDKVDWVPMGNARSVLSQMQEIAMSAAWILPIVQRRELPEFDEHARNEMERTRASYDTVEKCLEAAQVGTSEFCQAIAEFPESRLDEEMTLPFGGGMVMTMADILDLHRWNMVYHLGQINAIQLMLGDTEMH
ncbi:MAG: hypothetical protein KF784_07340 [Fimbriimonadaceae bacterium]|nr:hypothetical protein [Fimbriimonadaceae bacterium]